MLFRKSWKFITTNAHRNIIHYNHHHHPRHRQLINAHGRTFSTPSPSPPPPPQQHSNINSSLIFKWIAAGSLVIGVPSYLWLYRSKSNTDAKLTNNTNVSQKQEKDIDKSSIDSSLQLIENLPETVPYLIIGGGPSGFSAARTIRGNDPTARVLIITEENHYPYTRTPLTKELWFSGLDDKLSFKQYNGKERSIYFEHEEFYLPLNEFNSASHGGISVVKFHKINRLDVANQQAYLDNGQIIKYDKCIIATGTKPKNLKCFEQASEQQPQIEKKIILYRYPENYQQLNELLPKIKSLTLIGNGFTASELAFSLTERAKKLKSNVQINHIFEQDGVLNEVLPVYLSHWCTDRIKDENVNVISNVRIDDVKMDKDQLSLKLTNGQTLNTDICIVDIGSEPNIDIAKSAGFEIDPINGGLIANSELQIQSNIWAAGDVVSFYDKKHGRRRDCHHDNAIYTGRLAGDNASNGGKPGKPYSHNARFWSDLGADIGFEAIGMIDSKLPTFAMFAKSDPNDDGQYKHERGVLFYLKDKTIVGIILWNIFDVDNMHIARRVLYDGMKAKDLNDVARLFALYPSLTSSSLSAMDVDENSK
ncbi:apoptosis-inducing factor 1 [Dermatophagoides farinae]|uniref:Apoptosis-inducing factor 1 n=1 Tax=Dermatophagoides farinae TaxID=6954 RepID=A0A9D4NX66_DERFA|nr:apoptosis-inducing factor 1, mitochondrial-like [Dermatophagoides farinae]KAH7639597.1 apoptosis-inducing factor 1 [Dermatophagoides farinae]